MESSLYYEYLRFPSGLYDTLRMIKLIKEDVHDLGHTVFYHQNGYGLIYFSGRIDCKDVVYTALPGEKAANPDGGIDCKYAADFLLARSQ